MKKKAIKRVNMAVEAMMLLKTREIVAGTSYHNKNSCCILQALSRTLNTTIHGRSLDKIQQIFREKQLGSIEHAYMAGGLYANWFIDDPKKERGKVYSWVSDTAEGIRAPYGLTSDLTKKMIVILENIIYNNGEFVPES